MPIGNFFIFSIYPCLYAIPVVLLSLDRVQYRLIHDMIVFALIKWNQND